MLWFTAGFPLTEEKPRCCSHLSLFSSEVCLTLQMLQLDCIVLQSLISLLQNIYASYLVSTSSWLTWQVYCLFLPKKSLQEVPERSCSYSRLSFLYFVQLCKIIQNSCIFNLLWMLILMVYGHKWDCKAGPSFLMQCSQLNLMYGVRSVHDCRVEYKEGKNRNKCLTGCSA